ncbi:MAG: cytochrome c [Bacteroidia bacterium]|nr:cytochrome c [Bacteroidia bacterium]
MKKTLRNLFCSAGAIMIAVVLFAFVAPQDQKAGAPWVIPAKYKSMNNPQKGKADAENVGKLLYAKHCKSCHGGLGVGDGPKATSMKTKINSLKTAEFQGQSDGVIYFQSFIGRDEMPNFEKKIPDEQDRWAVVNYIRTLK